MNNSVVSLYAEDCALVDNYVYFIAHNYNIVFRIDISSGEISYVSSIPNEPFTKERIGANIQCVNNKLIFSPMRTESIWEYDLKKGDWREIRRDRIDDKGKLEIFSSVLYKNYIFFIGSSYPSIIKYDINTMQLSYYDEVYQRYIDDAKEQYDWFFRNNFAIVDNILYMASCVKNEVVLFDLDTCKAIVKEVGSRGNMYSGICFDGKYFYLSPRRNGAVVVWNGMDEFTEYQIFPNESDNRFRIGNIIFRDDKVKMCSLFDDTGYEILRNKGIIKIIPEKVSYRFYKVLGDGNYAYLMPNDDFYISIGCKTYKYSLSIQESKLADMYCKYMERNKDSLLLNDDIKTSLDMFMFSVSKRGEYE